VQAVAIGLVQHRQAVVGLVALQRIDPPAGPLLGRHTSRESNDQGGQTQGAEANGPIPRKRTGAWPGGMARGARAVVHPQQSDRGQR